jgi:thymidylate synthase
MFDVNFAVDLSTYTGEISYLPALNLRRVYPRTAFYELLWMLRGSTDANELKKKGIRIWDGNTSREFLDARGLTHLREGFIGEGYGKQFRDFGGVDQLLNVIDSITNDPNGRRHIISLWNPAELDKTALPPCHLLYNFMVEDNKLHLKFFQRSGDLILGCPMNMMFAGFFLTLMADMANLRVGKLAHSITDCHVYANHLDAAQELCQNRHSGGKMATFVLPPVTTSHVDLNLFHRFADDTWSKIDASLVYNPQDALPKEMLSMAT